MTRKEANNKKKDQGCTDQVLGFLGHKVRGLLISSYTCIHKTSKQPSGVFHDLDGVPVTDKVGPENPRIFSYSELYIGSKGFSEEEVLGSGGFGRVYRAVLPSDGSVVAVKCLAERGEQFEKTFTAELVAVAHLRHRNLVRLRGWCVHEDQLLLVYDYMPNRSLDRVLFRKHDKSSAASPVLGWERRVRIVGGLAAGLYYLHEQLETQIIHRDVKASNVMIDSNYNARLGDFGLARWLEHELGDDQDKVARQVREPNSMRSNKVEEFRLADSTRVGGTIGYLPPESFQRRGSGGATAKSDVFSFGVVVLEVASGRRAVDLAYPDEQMVLLDWVRRLADEGRILQAGDTRLPDGSYRLSDMERLIHLGLLCTLQNPSSRPSMKWIVEALAGSIPGKLPPLPSFRYHPMYISLSPSTTTTTATTTTTTTSSGASSLTMTISSSDRSGTVFVTAIGESTLYATATEAELASNYKDLAGPTNRSSPQGRNRNLFVVESPREISFKEIISATANFADSRRVAELDFGTAYCGTLDDGHCVMVKRLGMTKCPALRIRFGTELQNLARLRHRNLIQLRGWCTEQGEMLVVYDYSANRLLSRLLFPQNNIVIGHSDSVLRWHHRYSIIRSLASAILYLHEEWDEQVIHRNITSSSVTLDPDMNPRLGSFALAEFLSRNDQAHKAATASKAYKSVRGIFGYMSPEYIKYGEATTMADVYSFGVLILEMVSGQSAVDFRRPEVLLVDRVNQFEERDRPLQELVDTRLDGEYDQKQLTRLIKLGILCTRSDPALRPSMRQIVSILNGHGQLLQATPEEKEAREEWRQKNRISLCMARRVQALGIQ